MVCVCEFEVAYLLALMTAPLHGSYHATQTELHTGLTLFASHVAVSCTTCNKVFKLGCGFDYLGDSDNCSQTTSHMCYDFGHGIAGKAPEPFMLHSRTGISGTLHRISAMRNSHGEVYGLTYRVGRHLPGAVRKPLPFCCRPPASVLLSLLLCDCVSTADKCC